MPDAALKETGLRDMDIREALKQAIARAVEEGKHDEEIHDAFGTYISAGKRRELSEILAWWEAGIEPEALLEKLKAELQHLRELEEQEQYHPTFEWASDHYWECIYMGAGYGCEEAIRILQASIEK